MMGHLKRRCSVALILILASAAAQAFDSQQVLGYLQRLQASSGAPGVSAAVAVDGAIVFSGGVGVADVQSGTPQNGRSVHNIGSISKTQAVVAILQLVEQGKVDLDARVQKYLPWFPEKQKSVTLRAILTHTSGIRHYKDGEFGPANVLSFRHYDVFEESTRFWRDDPLVFEPGQNWRYSSFATNLLHGVIEAASGQGFEEYLREHVWEPSGMLETQFDVPSRIVPRRGRGYVRNEKTGVLENAQDENVSYKYAGGGVISTNEDMCRFAVALSAGRLLSAKSMAEMYRLQLRPDIPYTPEDAKAFEPGKAPPSMGLSQALIWQIHKDELGRVYASHSGTVKGTRSMLSNFKDAGVVVSLHINALPIDVDISDAAEALAQVFLADAPAAKGSRPKRD
jgi:serine beta-lactamase-like protein LACTB